MIQRWLAVVNPGRGLDAVLARTPTFGAASLRHEPVGDVTVTSGKIVACDPLVSPDRSPFALSVESGRYPVEVTFVEVEPSEYFGYVVDSGLGCFMDFDTARLLNQRMARLDGNYYNDVLAQEGAGSMHELFEPSRHEALVDVEWSPDAASAAMTSIASDAVNATHGGLWPPHPLEDGGCDHERSLYMGAAGVVWALHHLAAQGAIPHDDRFSTWIGALPELYLAKPDTGSVVPSYFLGEAGILCLALKVDQRAEWAARLAQVVDDNVDNPTREALWGAPGTMLAAAFLHDLTGEARWRDACIRNAQHLVDTWQHDDAAGCDVWVQDLYGATRKILGAAHGFAGNVFALLRTATFASHDEADLVFRRALRTLRTTAIIRDGLANWPSTLGPSNLLVQWCHGAPGIITSFGSAPPNEDLDDLLLKAGELTWCAGPLTKGPSLCHGTAGSGAAMLTLFSRTGNPLWLDRARRFAMHCIQQVDVARQTHGRGRYSLWTGDLGVAVFLWQCLNGSSGLPSLDF